MELKWRRVLRTSKAVLRAPVPPTHWTPPAWWCVEAMLVAIAMVVIALVVIAMVVIAIVVMAMVVIAMVVMVVGILNK